jgi:ABC-type sugar transport system ATPase subunit
MSENKVLLNLKNIDKTFPGVKALKNINFTIKEGEIQALVGENGAGKSTLCNIITGIIQPDIGNIFWEGNEVRFKTPNDALKMGIRMVYQERNLIPSLTGAQNIWLNAEPIKKWGILDDDSILAAANKLKTDLNIEINLNIPASFLSPSEKQMVEILRAVRTKTKLLILDEPTSSIVDKEVDKIIDLVKKLKEQETSILFISHKLQEVFRVADTISIFRDGENIFSEKKENLNEASCIKYMINRDLDHLYPEVTPVKSNEVVLVASHVGDDQIVKDINFELTKGEVLGFYGLIGSGRTEFAEILFGLHPRTNGEITVNSKLMKNYSSKEAIDTGIVMTPEDRKEHGIFHFFNISQNATVPYTRSFIKGPLYLIKQATEKNLAKQVANRLGLIYHSLNQNIDALSGGNKQKIVIGKWLLNDKNKIIIMDEPTQGIDVGAKYEIYNLIRSLAQAGVSIIFISSEMPELIGVCDRICVFKEGKITRSVNRADFNKEEILLYAIL